MLASRFLLFFSFIITSLFAQNTCSTAQFFKGNSLNVVESENETWYRFRAKGRLLNFVGSLAGTDSLLEYEIYEDVACKEIELGFSEPIRSTLHDFDGVSQEMWKLVEDEGRCVCSTCFSRIVIDYSKGMIVEQGKMYLLRIVSHKVGFEFKLTFDNVDELYPIQFDIDNVNVEQIEEGMVYQMKQLFFIPGQSVYLKSSLPELERIKRFLEKNKVLHVEVRGHVNGPANNKPVFYQELSDGRAKAVRDFLVEHGVEANRINIRGMSNKEMRYLSPKNEMEAIENRRVEIVITAVQ